MVDSKLQATSTTPQEPYQRIHPDATGMMPQTTGCGGWRGVMLAIFPAVPLAMAASKKASNLHSIGVFLGVTALYVGGIACFALGSAVDDSILNTDPDKQTPDTLAVLLVAWVLYMVGPVLTITVDVAIWLRWEVLSYIDDRGVREYHVSATSVLLLSAHLLCQLLIVAGMVVSVRQLRASDTWSRSCLGKCCWRVCCPSCWVGSTLTAASRDDKEDQHHDEIPAYNV